MTSEAVGTSHSAGAAAPIGALSRLALQETVAELKLAARRATAATSGAWRELRMGAERRLGIEMNIEDPVVRDLFGHLLQVENMLSQIRSHGMALMQGAQVLAEGPASNAAPNPLAGVAADVAASVRASVGGGGGPLPAAGADASKALAESIDAYAQALGAPPEPGSSVASAVGDALWQTLSLSPNAGEDHRGSARYRMERRLRDEVFHVMDQQIAEHDNLRAQLRERHRHRTLVEQCQRDVAAQQRNARTASKESGASGGYGTKSADVPVSHVDSGLQSLASGSRNEDAEKRLQAALDRMAVLDAEILGRLLAIRRDARMIVGAPWVALARIRADFFAGFAARWGPVATELSVAPSKPAASSVSPVTSAPAALPASLPAVADSTTIPAAPPPLDPAESPEYSAPVFAGTASLGPSFEGEARRNDSEIAW